MTVGRARRSSACTITAKRRPCWTRPRRRGSVIACTSPRTTKLFHERCDLARLADVDGVFRERCSLRCQAGAPALALRGLGDRLTRRLRTGEASSPSDLVERSQPVTAETQRERRGRRGSHRWSVAQFALQQSPQPRFRARAATNARVCATGRRGSFRRLSGGQVRCEGRGDDRARLVAEPRPTVYGVRSNGHASCAAVACPCSSWPNGCR